MRAIFLSLGALLVAALIGAAAFIFSGTYNMAADDPHWDITSRVIQELRVRSLKRRALEVTSVPDLADQQLISKGAGQYAAMCASCHLAPGMPANELNKGLYPSPPLLSRSQLDPKVSYIVIKHGIKMTGMPAWGGHHGDEQVWSLVAFVGKLPGMTPQQYQEYVRSPAANAASAMAAHDMGVMPQIPAAGTKGAAQGSHEMPGMEAKPPAGTGTEASGAHGPPGHHDAPASPRSANPKQELATTLPP